MSENECYEDYRLIRVTGRDGVNFARLSLSIRAGVQEIGQQHDFGKDAYVT